MALAWGVGGLLLAWLLHKLPWQLALAALQRPSLAVWAGVVSALLLSYGLRGARLQVVLGLAESQRPVRSFLGLRSDALRVILMHNAAVNLLPMRAGELSFPWLASRELGMPLARALTCLMWMRVQDLVILAWLGLLCWPGLPLAWRALGVSGLLLLGAGLHWGTRWLARLPEPALGSARARWQSALAEHSHHHPLAWLLTLANWAVKLSAGATLLAAVTEAPWLTSWAAALGGELAAVVPLQGPAGFGTYEAGVWSAMALLRPAGDPALTHAVVGALCLHACFLLCACVAGLGAWLLRAPAAHPHPTSPASVPVAGRTPS